MNQPPKHTTSGLLATMREWELKTDLGRWLKFPELVDTILPKPHMVKIFQAFKKGYHLETQCALGKMLGGGQQEEKGMIHSVGGRVLEERMVIKVRTH